MKMLEKWKAKTPREKVKSAVGIVVQLGCAMVIGGITKLAMGDENYKGFGKLCAGSFGFAAMGAVSRPCKQFTDGLIDTFANSWNEGIEEAKKEMEA